MQTALTWPLPLPLASSQGEGSLGACRMTGLSSPRSMNQDKRSRGYMKQIFPSIYLLPAEYSIGFSYIVVRPEGNLLIPNGLQATELSALISILDSLGGVSLVLACCKHNVKAVSVSADICRHYGVPLVISVPDSRGNTISPGEHVHPVPFKAAAIEPDIELIPLPGYTAGSLGFLWKHEDKRYLFTGVTLTNTDGAWKVWTVAGRAVKCIDGFESLRSLDFDVILLNSFANTEPAWYQWTCQEKSTVFDEAIAQVQQLGKKRPIDRV